MAAEGRRGGGGVSGAILDAPKRAISTCRLQSSGARLSHSLLSGHWYDALWPKAEQRTHQGVAFGDSQTATASTISHSVPFVSMPAFIALK